MSEKQRRIFLQGDEATDGATVFCGGPQLSDALEGIRMHLEEPIRQMLAGETTKAVITLSVSEMTCAEVDKLAEL